MSMRAFPIEIKNWQTNIHLFFMDFQQAVTDCSPSMVITTTPYTKHLLRNILTHDTTISKHSQGSSGVNANHSVRCCG